MKPPVRLLEDPSLEPELREALRTESARAIEFDVALGLERLSGAMNAGAQSAVSAGAWKLKLLLGAGATGALAAALVGLGISRPEAPPGPAASASAAAAPVAIASPSEPEVAVPVPAASVVPEPTPEIPSAAAPAPGPKTLASDKQARLAEEVRHLAEVRRLAAGNPAAAAQMADEGHQRFRGGMLYQEREAVAISALARAGRQTESRSRAARFLERFPKSPFADQVRAVTGMAPVQ
jgi:hypothetical protein